MEEPGKRLLKQLAAKLDLVIVKQGSPNVFARGPHKLLHNSTRAVYLTSCDCFKICFILPNKQIFWINNIFSWRKQLCRPDEMAP